MGVYFLFALIACFWVYEAVMHFVFKNAGGNATLSELVFRLYRWQPRIRLLVGAAVAALFAHLVLEWF